MCNAEFFRKLCRPTPLPTVWRLRNLWGEPRKLCPIDCILAPSHSCVLRLIHCIRIQLFYLTPPSLWASSFRRFSFIYYPEFRIFSVPVNSLAGQAFGAKNAEGARRHLIRTGVVSSRSLLLPTCLKLLHLLGTTLHTGSLRPTAWQATASLPL